jgi:hypothetical protein
MYFYHSVSSGLLAVEGRKGVLYNPAVGAFRYYAAWVRKIYGETIPVDGPFLKGTLREPAGGAVRDEALPDPGGSIRYAGNCYETTPALGGSLASDGTFTEVLRSLLTTCSVVFIGYSLRDQYLLDLLGRNADLLSLFGDGPHFLISAEERLGLPESVNIIRYRTDLHTDHRSGILAVELLGRPPEEADLLRYDRAKCPPLQSAHFLNDFYPGGIWSTMSGQVLGLKAEDGTESQLVIGPNWTDEELPQTAATAAFDLAVGLICFDRVVLLIGCVGSAYRTLGEELFDRLVAEDVLQFVQYDSDDGVMFKPPMAAFGSIVTGKAPWRTPMVQIKRQLFLPGREELTRAQFELLESKVKRVDLSGTLNFADVCNGLLISPITRNAWDSARLAPWAISHAGLRRPRFG